jgi:altronate hydrolase
MMYYPLEEKAILLREEDDVAVAKQKLEAGTVLVHQGKELCVLQEVPPGHKVALRDIEEGASVRKYGQVIGFAARRIRAGDWVHTHNLAVGQLEQEALRNKQALIEHRNSLLSRECGAEARAEEPYPPEQRRTFLGFVRPNGRVGTRNYVAVVSTVNCSAGAVRAIAQRLKDEALGRFPNVDGVFAATHKGGCGTAAGGTDHRILQRVLAGFIEHPNVAAAMLVGLGCEVDGAAALCKSAGLAPVGSFERPGEVVVLNIQECGGVQKTIERGLKEGVKLLEYADGFKRTPAPASGLVVATNCGGSDAYSGITANPALGMAGDELVRHGGTWVLGETTEIYGAEHLLVRRAASREVAEKLLDLIEWWKRYTSALGAEIDNNPSPGNKAGGITTIYEKSLGAVTKGGSTPLMAVYDYAERIRRSGLCFMDTPGFDPVSVTGMVAGGCNVVAFTTGRGSCLGFKPAPCIKIASNTPLYEAMKDDMDVDAGVMLSGVSMRDVALYIFEEILAVASGKRTKSELQDLGEEEFAPWVVGPVL